MTTNRISIAARGLLIASLTTASLAVCAQSSDNAPQNSAPQRRPRRAAAEDGPAKPWTQTYTPDGQPNWQGFWRANPGGDTYNITGAKPRPDFNLQGNGPQRPALDRVSGTPDGQIPYQPWAAAHYKEIFDNIDDPTKPEYVDTQAHCLLEGPGRVFIHSGFEVIQTPGYIVFLTEQNDEQVIVPLDGHPHVGKDILLWQGDRRGHWEGNTLVVDVTNVKGKSRLDMTGNFYGPGTHFEERYTQTDADTIQYQALVTNPEVFTQPWTLNIRFKRTNANDPTYELWEDACHEGERSADRLVISPEAAKVNAAAAAKAQAAQETGKQ
jgi:hypothetical protein